MCVTSKQPVTLLIRKRGSISVLESDPQDSALKALQPDHLRPISQGQEYSKSLIPHPIDKEGDSVNYDST